MAKGFTATLDDMKADAMKRGALDAREGIVAGPLENKYIQKRLERYSGSFHKNAEAVMVSGYHDGYTKAQQWLASL